MLYTKHKTCSKYDFSDLESKTALHFELSKKTPSNVSYLAVADCKGRIVVWSQNNKKFEHYVTLPKYRCIPAALSINSETQCLIVVYVDQKVITQISPMVFNSKLNLYMYIDRFLLLQTIFFTHAVVLMTKEKLYPA